LSSSSSLSSSDTSQQEETQQQKQKQLSSAVIVDPSVVVATGTVVANQQGLLIVKVQSDGDNGEAGDLIGKEVLFANQKISGLVVIHRPPLAFCYVNNRHRRHHHHHDNQDSSSSTSSMDTSVVEGKVQILHSLARVQSQSTAAGTVDAFGRSMETRNESESLVLPDTGEPGRAIFSPIPRVQDIALINSPVLTGITMIDALAPIGRGQNMLWITHDVESTRQYFLDWVQRLCEDHDNTPVIYAALDTDEVTLSQLPSKVQVVKRQMTSTTATATKDDHVRTAAEGVAMAGAACALAEQHALLHGRHAVVIVDTLDGHKVLWDATTRALVDIFGVDAVVQGERDGGASSEMRAFYSSLIQRSAQYKAKKGGGSVTLVLLTTIPLAVEGEDDGSDRVYAESDFATAPLKVRERIELLLRKNIPLTEANLRKIQIPIPSDAEGRRRHVLQYVDDLISMSDGQIWLDEDLAKAGQCPPMDPQRSVTRIGIGADTVSRADAPALRKVVEGLRLLLSQATDNLVGVSESNAKATRNQILRQKALQLVLHQKPGSGARRLSESCALLLAASEGLLDEAVRNDEMLAGQQKGAAFVQGLLQYLHKEIPSVFSEIDETLDLTDDNKATMLQALKTHLS
jgi:F-type H+-transporting ATPase subunit alpha